MPKMESEIFTFAVGDTVVLKSGSRYMTVAEMDDVGGSIPTIAVVVWMVWDTGEMQKASLPAAVLRKADDRGKVVERFDGGHR